MNTTMNNYSLAFLARGVMFCAVFLLVTTLNCQQIKSGLDPSKNLEQFLIEHWTSRDGLPSNSLTDVMFSEDGFLWISGYNGIAVFDGYQFRVYDKTNLPLLKNNGVYRFFKGNNNDVWICTNGSGLLRFQNGQFERMYENELPDNTLTGFVDGEVIWVGTVNQGLYKIENNEVQKIDFAYLKNVTIVNVDKDLEGALWFSTDGRGISKYYQNTFTSYAAQFGTKFNRIQDIFCRDDGSLLVGTFEGLFEIEKDVLSSIKVFEGLIVSKIEQDDYGNLWMATNVGLARKNVETNEYEFLEETTSMVAGELTSLEFDDQNNLWMASSRDGLLRLSTGAFFNYTERQGLISNRVNSFLELENGDLMVGTENGQLQIINGNEIRNFPIKTDLQKSRIRNLFKDSKSNIWVSTYLGLLKVMPNGDEKLYTTEDGFPSTQIRQVTEDNKGVLWVATRNAGVVKWLPNDEKIILNNKNGINADFILSFGIYDKGIILNTNDGGISLIDKSENITNYGIENGLTASVVFSNYVDGDKIWLATNVGVGVLHDDSVFMASLEHIQLNGAVFDILEDDIDNLWISSSLGIVKVNKKQLLNYLKDPEKIIAYDIFDENDGLVTRECIGAVRSFKSSDGRLWFPTLEGLSVIDPNNLQRQSIAPKPYIVAAYVDNKTNEIELGEEMAPDFKRLTFQFTAPHFIAANKVKFMYKLEGYDETWNQLLGTEREAQYTNLGYGNYEFKVRASNSEGKWNDEYAVITFSIKKHFYQTYVFIGASIFLLAALLVGSFKWRIKSVEDEKKQLEVVVLDRTSEIEMQKEEIESQRDRLIKSLDHLENAQKTIGHQNEKLVSHNEELEEKVKLRTSELGNAMKNILNANKELDHFLYRAAHDLRGPVLRLLGIVNLSQIDKDYFEQGLFYKNLKDTILDMDDLIRKLMWINELKNKKPRMSPVDLSVFIPEVFKRTKNSQSLKFINKIELKNCVTDPMLLELMLAKMFENAVQFLDKHKTENYIKVEVVELPGSNMFRILISDNGIGIEDTIHSKIFDMFSKGHNKGFGLGLYEAKIVVKKLKGEINLLDEINEELVFEILLPDHDDKRIKKSNEVA